MSKLTLGDLSALIKRGFSCVKRTVFFKKGGGLLFLLLVVLSAYLTILISPTFEQDTFPGARISSCTCGGGQPRIPGSPTTISCGTGSCEVDNRMWRCNDDGNGNGAWSGPHEACGSDTPQTCTPCTDARPLGGGSSTVACGQTSCEIDSRTWTCDNINGRGTWRYVGVACGGNTQTCSCPGAQPLVPGSPTTIACGQTSCERDSKYWKCNAPGGDIGWENTNQACTGNVGGACQCPGAQPLNGGSSNVACGQTSCERDHKTWKCNSPGGNAGWQYVGTACGAGVTPPAGGGGGRTSTCDAFYQARGFATYAAACQSINQTACAAGSSTGACKCSPCDGGGGSGNPTSTPVPGGGGNPTSTPVPGGGNPTSTPIPGATATPVPGTNATPVPGATATPILPTATPAPLATNIAFAVTVKGIGAGENTNPYPNVRTANIEIYDAKGKKISTLSPELDFDRNSSSFKGSMTPSLATGLYQIKIKLDTTLSRNVTIGITGGKDVTLPTLALITGDLNGDNALNLIDYNAMLSCYGGKACDQPGQSPLGGGNKSKTDLNMDGTVDERDLNIFYAELRTRLGD